MSENQLLIGFGRADITPSMPVPMAGYGNTSMRFSANLLDPLYATCIAFTQGDDTVLLYTQDMLFAFRNMVLQLREKLNEELGIPEERILICGTHTHSAPDMNSAEPAIEAYKPEYLEAMTQAARAALEDRVPAKLYGAKGYTQGLNFIRHYLRSDGTVVGDNFGYFSKAPIVGHVEESDNEMVLVKMERQGKKDILLVNWQAHPSKTGGGKKQDMSADFPGVVCAEIEKRTDMLCAYFTGAAGNHNSSSRIQEEQNNLDHLGLGAALADVAIATLPEMKQIGGDGLKLVSQRYEHDVNHAEEDRLEIATEILKKWRETGDTAEVNKLAWAHGFHSVYHCSAVSGRPKYGPRSPMELVTFRVGDLAFVNAPCEMFSRTGKHLKARSPYDVTVICSCANQNFSYFATEDAFDYGCFESQLSYFARGVAENAEEELVKMLNMLQ